MDKQFVTVTCQWCKQKFAFKVTAKQIAEIMLNEKHIQHILPEFTPSERELFVSHTCKTCWDEMFPPEEEEVIIDCLINCSTCNKTECPYRSINEPFDMDSEDIII